MLVHIPEIFESAAEMSSMQESQVKGTEKVAL